MAFQYSVRQGQTPTSIAGQFNLDPADLLKANRGATPFDVGQTIRIPSGGKPLFSEIAPPPAPISAKGSVGVGRAQRLSTYQYQPVAPRRPSPAAPRFDAEVGPLGPNPQALPRVNAPKTLRVASEQMVTGGVPNYKADLADMIFGRNVPDQLSLWQADYANQLFAGANPTAPPLYVNGQVNPEVAQAKGTAGGGEATNYRGGSFENRFFQLRGEKSGGFVRGRGGGGRNRRLGIGGGGGGGGGGTAPQAPAKPQQLLGLLNFTLRASTG